MDPVHAPPYARRLLVIGNFDGVHLGHQSVLEHALLEARSRGIRPAVLTFDPHPAVILTGRQRPVLTTLAQKERLIQAGRDELEMIVLRFDQELSEQTPAEFASHVLKETLGAEVVVVGANFRFGHARSGDLVTLQDLGKEYGFIARSEELRGDQEGAFSSTRIRQSLSTGDVVTAARLLGRPYEILGEVVEGDGRGRKLGFPTANLSAIAHVLPAAGVYFGTVTLPGGAHVQAVVHVGARPTVDRPETVEAHLLDFDGDVYGLELGVHFEGRLRDVVQFDGVDELTAQISADIARARVLLGPSP